MLRATFTPPVLIRSEQSGTVRVLERIRTSVTNADNSRWLYAYDPLGQLTSAKKYWSDGTVVAGQQFEYGFDDTGNRRFAASGGNEWGSNLRYENDTVNNLNQYTQRKVPPSIDVLGTATNTSTVTVNNQPAYRKADYFRRDLAIDNAGGPLYQGITNVAVINTGGTNKDTVTNITGNLLLPKGLEFFTYDPDGNLTSDSVWTNIWDGENRTIVSSNLTTVPSTGRMREEWSYMPDGRWLERVVYTWNGSSFAAQSTNRFIWDGSLLIVILDHTNGIVMSLMRGSDLSASRQGGGGAGGLLTAAISGNGAHCAAFDGNGNVAGLVNAADGKLSATYEYAPFGGTLRQTGPVAAQNPIRFSTQYGDDTTIEIRYLHRNLSTVFGRWTARDPVEDNRARNPYTFVANNPPNAVDILGLKGLSLSYINSDFGLSGQLLAGNATYADNLSQILTDIKARIPKPDPSGKCGDCIKQLNIAAHSGVPGYVTFSPTNSAYHGRQDVIYIDHSISPTTPLLLSELQKYLCYEANIYFEQCDAGSGTCGLQLVQSLSRRLGVSVTTLTSGGVVGYPKAGKITGYPGGGILYTSPLDLFSIGYQMYP